MRGPINKKGKPSRKTQTRALIVKQAKHLFIERGFANVSIDEVMAASGLTRGVFYTYFDSKVDLYAQALSVQDTTAFVNKDEVGAKRWQEKALADIVDPQHLSTTLPLRVFAKDDYEPSPEYKRAYTQVLKQTLRNLMERLNLDWDRGEAVLLATVAKIVGAELLCQKLDDAYLADKIRDACCSESKIQQTFANDELLWDYTN